MNITKNKDGSKLTLTLEGRLDTTTAPDFQDTLLGEIKTGKSILLDFSELAYVSSAGLRSILIGAKSMRERNGFFAIANAGEKIRRVFQLSGLAKHFHSFESVDAAAEYVAGAGR